MSLDLAYPLRKGGSLFDDIELRFSLRSVAKYLRMDVGRVFLYGHRPAWVKDVVYTNMLDRTDKALNLKAKYARMVDDGDLSDPFLLLDDDHVFLRPTDTVPLHTRGMLATFKREFGSTTYGRYLANALEALRKAGLPERNYQIHYPLLIHKAVLRRALALMDKPMVMGSLYGNLIDGPTVETPHDLKARNLGEWEKLRDGPFISLVDRMLREPAVFTRLGELFPEPSPWEMPDLPGRDVTMVRVGGRAVPVRRVRPLRRPTPPPPSSPRDSDVAAVIRLCYPEGVAPDAEVDWRFEWFRSEVLPRIYAQEDASVDVWVWIDPRHKERVEAMDPRVRTFTVEAGPLRRHPIRNGHPWSSVRGLPRYPVQLLFGSDDLIGPRFVRTALDRLAKMRQPRALVHFQPYKFDVATGRIHDCGISVPETGEYHYRNDMTSMFQALRQPVRDPRYTWVWAVGHTRMFRLVREVALIPTGHALLSVHRWNDSTKITAADAPMDVVLDWAPAPRAT